MFVVEYSLSATDALQLWRRFYQLQTSLGNPSPDLADKSRRLLLVPNLSIERSFTRPDIRVRRLDERLALEQLPAQIQTSIDRNTNVRRQEILNGPVAVRKDGEAVEEDNHNKVDQREPSRVGLPGGFEG